MGGQWNPPMVDEFSYQRKVAKHAFFVNAFQQGKALKTNTIFPESKKKKVFPIGGQGYGSKSPPGRGSPLYTNMAACQCWVGFGL